MNHKSTIDIESDRLLLRRFVPEDIPLAFKNWTSDDEVTKYLTWPSHKDLSVTEAVIGDWIKSYSDPSFYQWAIVLKDLGEPIGSITVVHSDEEVESLEIGYCIGRKWWNMGYTSEAFMAVIPFLFEEVKAKKILAKHIPENPGSGRVMDHAGLKKEGQLRRVHKTNYGINDLIYYGLLAEEYFANK